MFSQVFYHGTIRKYVILFGTLFNEIFIRRGIDEGEDCTDADTIIRVPITYGPKDKILERINQDPNLSRPFSTILPRLSFEMTKIVYDGNRKLNTIGRDVGPNDNKDIANYMYNPVPYNFMFKLYVMIKNVEDGTKILEQILPYFTPEWTTTIKIIDNPEIIRDIPVVLVNIDHNDTWEQSYQDRRYMIWSLDFVLKGYLYGPVKRDKIIKVAKTNISFDPYTTNTELATTYANLTNYATLTVQPGLLANGSPTSNAELTLPYSQIDWDDDYGFVVSEEVYPNGVEE